MDDEVVISLDYGSFDCETNNSTVEVKLADAVDDDLEVAYVVD